MPMRAESGTESGKRESGKREESGKRDAYD